MKWVYVFSTGEISEVEVSEELGAVLKDMEHKEKLDRRRHEYWNTPMSAFDDAESLFADDHDVLGEVLRRCDKEALCVAMEQLHPSQKELLKRVYWQGKSIASIARDEGVYPSAISNRLDRIHKFIVKNLR